MAASPILADVHPDGTWIWPDGSLGQGGCHSQVAADWLGAPKSRTVIYDAMYRGAIRLTAGDRWLGVSVGDSPASPALETLRDIVAEMREYDEVYMDGPQWARSAFVCGVRFTPEQTVEWIDRNLQGQPGDMASAARARIGVRESIGSLDRLLTEMPPPAEWQKASTWYHGTAGRVRARDIIRNGVNPNKAGNYKGADVSRKGFVYLTQFRGEAERYAEIAAGVGEERVLKSDPYGYVFEIPGEALKDVEPDEDDVLKRLQDGTAPEWLEVMAAQAGAEFDPDSLDWDFDAAIYTVKKLMQKMTDEQKVELMAGDQVVGDPSMGSGYANVAHRGVLRPSRVWRKNMLDRPGNPDVPWEEVSMTSLLGESTAPIGIAWVWPNGTVSATLEGHTVATVRWFGLSWTHQRTWEFREEALRRGAIRLFDAEGILSVEVGDAPASEALHALRDIILGGKRHRVDINDPHELIFQGTPDDAVEYIDHIMQVGGEFIGSLGRVIQEAEEDWDEVPGGGTTGMGSEEITYFLEDIYDEELEAVVAEFKRKRGKGRVSWAVVPAARLIKIWQDYAKTGVVRDEAGMQEIKDRMLHNAQRLRACTELMGHTSLDMRPELEERGIEFTDEEWEDQMPNFFTDPHGTWRLSDYGLEPLLDLSFDLVRAKTAEDQLQVVDQMLSVAHRRGDMAANFVQGGRATLGKLATESIGGLGSVLFEDDWFSADRVRKRPEIFTIGGRWWITDIGEWVYVGGLAHTRAFVDYMEKHGRGDEPKTLEVGGEDSFADISTILRAYDWIRVNRGHFHVYRVDRKTLGRLSGALEQRREDEDTYPVLAPEGYVNRVVGDVGYPHNLSFVACQVPYLTGLLSPGARGDVSPAQQYHVAGAGESMGSLDRMLAEASEMALDWPIAFNEIFNWLNGAAVFGSGSFAIETIGNILTETTLSSLVSSYQVYQPAGDEDMKRIRDVRVTVDESLGTRGTIEGETRFISVYPNLEVFVWFNEHTDPRSVVSTVLHEIVHAIQGAADPGSWERSSGREYADQPPEVDSYARQIATEYWDLVRGAGGARSVTYRDTPTYEWMMTPDGRANIHKNQRAAILALARRYFKGAAPEWRQEESIGGLDRMLSEAFEPAIIYTTALRWFTEWLKSPAHRIPRHVDGGDYWFYLYDILGESLIPILADYARQGQEPRARSGFTAEDALSSTDVHLIVDHAWEGRPKGECGSRGGQYQVSIWYASNVFAEALTSTFVHEVEHLIERVGEVFSSVSYSGRDYASLSTFYLARPQEQRAYAYQIALEYWNAVREVGGGSVVDWEDMPTVRKLRAWEAASPHAERLGSEIIDMAKQEFQKLGAAGPARHDLAKIGESIGELEPFDWGGWVKPTGEWVPAEAGEGHLDIVYSELDKPEFRASVNYDEQAHRDDSGEYSDILLDNTVNLAGWIRVFAMAGDDDVLAAQLPDLKQETFARLRDVVFSVPGLASRLRKRKMELWVRDKMTWADRDDLMDTGKIGTLLRRFGESSLALTYYHGTSAEAARDILVRGFQHGTGYGVGERPQRVPGRETGVFITPDRAVAQAYAETPPTDAPWLDAKLRSRYPTRKGVVIPVRLKEWAKEGVDYTTDVEHGVSVLHVTNLDAVEPHEAVTESILDPTRQSLDPDLFIRPDDPPPLRPGVRAYLYRSCLHYSQWGRVVGIYLTGSLLSYQWTETTDADVKIVLEPHDDEALWAAVKDATARTDRGLIQGTQHPVDFFIVTPDEWATIQPRLDGVYDVLNDKWVHGPYSYTVEVQDFLGLFDEAVQSLDVAQGELKRDLVDYETLQEMSKHDLEQTTEAVMGKLAEIDRGVRRLSQTFAILQALRGGGFRLADIEAARSGQTAPGNVLYKLLERYHYVDLLKKLRQAVREAGGKITTPAAARAVRGVVGEARSYGTWIMPDGSLAREGPHHLGLIWKAFGRGIPAGEAGFVKAYDAGWVRISYDSDGDLRASGRLPIHGPALDTLVGLISAHEGRVFLWDDTRGHEFFDGTTEEAVAWLLDGCPRSGLAVVNRVEEAVEDGPDYFSYGHGPDDVLWWFVNGELVMEKRAYDSARNRGVDGTLWRLDRAPEGFPGRLRVTHTDAPQLRRSWKGVYSIAESIVVACSNVASDYQTSLMGYVQGRTPSRLIHALEDAFKPVDIKLWPGMKSVWKQEESIGSFDEAVGGVIGEGYNYFSFGRDPNDILWWYVDGKFIKTLRDPEQGTKVDWLWFTPAAGMGYVHFQKPPIPVHTVAWKGYYIAKRRWVIAVPVENKWGMFSDGEVTGVEHDMPEDVVNALDAEFHPKDIRLWPDMTSVWKQEESIGSVSRTVSEMAVFHPDVPPVLYHATTPKRAASILQRGILPHWAGGRELGAYVWFAETPQQALNHARRRATEKGLGADLVVLRVDIPDEAAAHVFRFTTPGLWVYRGRVNPTWVSEEPLTEALFGHGGDDALWVWDDDTFVWCWRRDRLEQGDPRRRYFMDNQESGGMMHLGVLSGWAGSYDSEREEALAVGPGDSVDDLPQGVLDGLFDAFGVGPDGVLVTRLDPYDVGRSQVESVTESYGSEETLTETRRSEAELGVDQVQPRDLTPDDWGWLGPDGAVWVLYEPGEPDHDVMARVLDQQDQLGWDVQEYIAKEIYHFTPEEFEDGEAPEYDAGDLVMGMLQCGWSRWFGGEAHRRMGAKGKGMNVEVGVGAEDVVQEFVSDLRQDLFDALLLEDTDQQWRWRGPLAAFAEKGRAAAGTTVAAQFHRDDEVRESIGGLDRMLSESEPLRWSAPEDAWLIDRATGQVIATARCETEASSPFGLPIWRDALLDRRDRVLDVVHTHPPGSGPDLSDLDFVVLGWANIKSITAIVDGMGYTASKRPGKPPGGWLSPRRIKDTVWAMEQAMYSEGKAGLPGAEFAGEYCRRVAQELGVDYTVRPMSPPAVSVGPTAPIEERYGGAAKLRSIWYHGTSPKFLRSILSQGLIPDPKERAWAEDPHATSQTPSRASYGGTYVARSIGTAISSSQKWSPQGPWLIIVLELQPRSLVVDEDDLVYTLKGSIPNQYVATQLYFGTLFGWVEGEGKKWLDDTKAAYVQDFRDMLKRYWKDDPIDERLWAALVPMVEEAWWASVIRYVSYFAKDYGDHTEYEWQSKYAHTGGEYGSAPPVPDSGEAEAAFRAIVARIGATLRQFVEKEYEHGRGWGLQTARSVEPIGYSGSNRIVAVIELRPYVPKVREKALVLIHYGTVPRQTWKDIEKQEGPVDTKDVSPRGEAPGATESIGNLARFVEAAGRSRYYYHCTSADRIPLILERGLVPATETHWGGDLGAESVGKVFFGLSPHKATYYGLIVFRETLASEGMAYVPVLLRVDLSGFEVAPDYNDVVVNRAVPPDRIEGIWQGVWRPLAELGFLGEEMYYTQSDRGGYEDWEGEPTGDLMQTVRGAKRLMVARRTAESIGGLDRALTEEYDDLRLQGCDVSVDGTWIWPDGAMETYPTHEDGAADKGYPGGGRYDGPLPGIGRGKMMTRSRADNAMVDGAIRLNFQGGCLDVTIDRLAAAACRSLLDLIRGNPCITRVGLAREVPEMYDDPEQACEVIEGWMNESVDGVSDPLVETKPRTFDTIFGTGHSLDDILWSWGEKEQKLYTTARGQQVKAGSPEAQHFYNTSYSDLDQTPTLRQAGPYYIAAHWTGQSPWQGVYDVEKKQVGIRGERTWDEQLARPHGGQGDFIPPDPNDVPQALLNAVLDKFPGARLMWWDGERYVPFSSVVGEAVQETRDFHTGIPRALMGLAAEARKCASFEEFEHDYSREIKHGKYWHVTSDPNFTIDLLKGPRDMSSMASGGAKVGKLMITSHLEFWLCEYPKEDRGYVAEIDMSGVPRDKYWQVSRGFGNEFWVDDPSGARVVRVLTRKQAVAHDRYHHNLVPQSKDELRAFYTMATDRADEASVEEAVQEFTGSGAVGAYERPLGAARRKPRRRRRGGKLEKETVGALDAAIAGA